ncbi:uncharacterized protein G2W53_014928 [Senna tora]|uniref:Uncharacterized protein n=2 Tax=Senna tora TaxID=362788 RepID=A0A834WU85_9FABA|nr:uncharacterized protein G2W53_014928 [Senna tora]
MDIEKVKWMFAQRASDFGIVELLLLILKIPQYDFNIKVLARQEPVENPKQSRARDFLHLPPNQTLPLPQWRRLLLLHSPEALLRFLRQDLLQRDDGAERSVATIRWHREICSVAMDPPSMCAEKRVLGLMDIEKVKWMFALRASDSGIVSGPSKDTCYTTQE